MYSAFNPLDFPILFSSPRRTTPHSTWHQHIPFGMLMVEFLQPRVVVELGTYFGDSYCAFCQAVETLRLPTKCYAVDTWAGDDHVGFYGADVLADLRAHHDRLYGAFSQLLQSSFETAASQFADQSIDLLHIDGCHTYEAVKHDFDTWLPKLSERGVILLHDTFARLRDFGAWRFWSEIKDEYPSFEFFHGHGLGVLCVGREPAPDVLRFVHGEGSRADAVRSMFFKLGSALEHEVHLSRAKAEIAQLRARQSELEANAVRLEHASRRFDASRLGRGVARFWRVKAALRGRFASPTGTLAER
jgi:hypothetical protein